MFSWRVFLILLGSACSTLVFAGEGGVETHGGDGVVCKGQPIQILDFYEASLPDLSGAKSVLPIDNMTFKEVIAVVENRLKPTRLWGRFQASFSAVGDVRNWKVVDLHDVKDTEQLYPLPPNCRLKQAAARRGHTVFIDKEVSDSISQGQLAVLAIHETIFAMFDTFGASRTRAIVGQLIMEEFSPERLASDLVWVKDYLFPYQKLMASAFQVESRERQRNILWLVKFESIDLSLRQFKMQLFKPKTGTELGSARFTCDQPGLNCVAKIKKGQIDDKQFERLDEIYIRINPISEGTVIQVGGKYDLFNIVAVDNFR